MKIKVEVPRELNPYAFAIYMRNNGFSYLYVMKYGWLEWDDYCELWNWTTEQHVVNCADILLDVIYDEAINMPEGEEKERLLKDIEKMREKKNINKAVTLLRHKVSIPLRFLRLEPVWYDQKLLGFHIKKGG